MKNSTYHDEFPHLYRDCAQRAEAEVSRATRHSLPLSRLVVDSDRFTLVTGTHGHPVGDQVLKAVADLLREGVGGDSVIIRIRRSDVIVRYGGEECAVLPPMTRTDGALVTGERVDDSQGRGHALDIRGIQLPDGDARRPAHHLRLEGEREGPRPGGLHDGLGRQECRRTGMLPRGRPRSMPILR